MILTDAIKGLLALRGKKQIELAQYFGMSKQAMNNKISKNSWFGKDLINVAEFCGCKLAFILPDGQQIILENKPNESKD